MKSSNWVISHLESLPTDLARLWANYTSVMFVSMETDPAKQLHMALEKTAKQLREDTLPVTYHPVFGQAIFAPFNLAPVAMRIAGLLR